MASIYLIRKDQPLGDTPDTLGCWELDIPEGQTWDQAAADFAKERGFPIGTVATVVHPDVEGAAETFRLQQQWVSYVDAH